MLNKKFIFKTFVLGYMSLLSFTTVYADNINEEELIESNYVTNIDENVIVLSYDEALQRAIKANNSIRALQENLDVLEDQRKNALNLYDQTRNYGNTEDRAVEAIRSVVSLQYSMLNTSSIEKILKDTAEYMLITHLTNIAKYELDIELLEENINLQELNYKNTQLKNTLGMVSENDLNRARRELEQSYSNLEMLKLTLTSEYEALNKLLSFKIDEQVIVLYTPNTERREVSITSYISGMTEQDPNVETKRQALKQAEYRRDTRLSSESRIEVQNNVNNAERDLQEAKDKVESTIRAVHSKLEQSLKNRNLLELALEKALSDYSAALSRYEAGTGTLLDAEQADLAVLSAKLDLEKNNYDYAIQLFLFNHPHLS